MLKNLQGIVTVHLVGPMHLLKGLYAPEDIGICAVKAAFEGTVSRGRRLEVGETLRFQPELLFDAKGAFGGVIPSERRIDEQTGRMMLAKKYKV